MKIGIIAAMPEELKILVENLENAEKHLRLGHVYHTGSIGRHEVVLVESGIGKVMSAMSVAVLVNDFKVTAVINTGSAGAVAEGLEIGDIVVADRLVYHDVDVTAFGYEYGQMARQPLYFEASRYLVAEMKKVLEKTHQTSRVGLIATGDSFVAGQDKIHAIKQHFPDVLAVEMEGAAIAQATHSIGLPFMVLRAMSDTASHDANVTFDEFILEAVLTLGICAPWGMCILYNWKIKHTVIDGHRLYFDGTAMQLFGNWVKWWLLTIITFGIYGFWLNIKLTQWITKHTHHLN